MKALSAFTLALLFARSALAATGSLAARYPPDDDDNDDDDNGGSSTSTTTTSQSSTAVQGDSRCVSNMCIEAVVNGSTVQYTLTAQRSSVGWIGMGFGSSMAGSPMVIMWPNSDGSITLSQRQASGEVEPQVVSSPPRVATLQQSLSVTSGSNPKFVYTVPANSDTRQSIIYAFGTTNPGSSAPNARLLQHTSYGTTTLDLSKVTGGSSTTTPGSGSSSTELTSNQRTLFAHAIIATLGFLLFLPIGALLPRYLRTFVAGPTWFKSHWIIQFLFGGITIIIGVALGIAGVSNRGAVHVNTTHKRLGIVLFALYFLQVGIGAFIHWVKPRQPRARPPQNYFHAILGLIIIALAFYQVRTGFRNEWPRATGRDDVPNGVNIVWYIWVVALPLAYGAGMAFLPKQYAQERKLRESSGGQ
ncbi:hypothetical protein EST38_g232 [Candolleomyces aberdarensis]|uniref:CBD9-like protein n=1 Tax=Candolleomyces aberdarensis TaxID=2316362 RepID=A0A4Q2DZ77_9AGAR|nr:hypothetical protein EST38_g232 [Candolleomyces aberdarensis]